MKVNARSTITLPRDELVRIERLKRRVGAKTNIGVVRNALRLLEEIMDRERLRSAYREASRATRSGLHGELKELDHLAAEGLDD